MYSLTKNILIGVFCLFSCLAKTQVPSSIHYEVGNGLPSNELYNLKQDSNGFLWIGTDAGLTRFNGHSFKLYTNQQLRGASVTGIQEDSKGNIWCHNFSGQVLTIKNDSLSIYEPWNKHYNTQLIEIALDNNDNLYISNFKNFIYQFNINNNQYQTIGNKNEVKQSIFINVNNQLVYSNLSNKKVNIIEKNSIKEVSFLGLQQLPTQDSVHNTFVFFNSTKNQQTLGFQRQHPLDKFPTLYSLTNNTLTVHPLTTYLRKENIYPLSVLNDDEGNCFVGTFKGCYWFKEVNGIWQFQKLLFVNKAISSIIKDKEGNYWFATLKNGLYQIPNLTVKIFNEEEVKLPDNIIGALATDGKDQLFVSGSGKEISVLNAKEKKLMRQYVTKDSRDVQGFVYDTFFNRLLYYKSNFSIIKEGVNQEYKGLSSASKDFFVRKDGVIFSAGVTLVALYPSTIKKKFLEDEFIESEGLTLTSEAINTTVFNFFTLSNQRSRAVWYDELHKVLWSANADGVVYFKNKQQYKLYDIVTKQPIIATCFNQLSNGNLCIGTIEQGVYLVNGTTIVKQLSIKNGLLSNRIKKIKTHLNNLFIVTNTGLQKIDITNETVYNLTNSNGLVSQEIFDIAIVADNIYLSTTKGLQLAPLQLTSKNSTAPYLSIKEMITQDSVYKQYNNINLQSNNSNIAFSLDGAALKSRGNFMYNYRLLGLDTSWITIDANNNIVRYPSLPAGKYTFEAISINEDGVQSKVQTVQFTVLNPWYKRWWFIGLGATIALLFVFMITRNNLTKKRVKIEEALMQSRVQEELRQSQLASLKAQMNPHFMFNALNSIQEFILLNDKKQANMYMGKFADLMRLTLDHSNKAVITLEDEIKILQLYLQLEALRFEDNFSYTIHQENINEALSVAIPAMLIQPYVENAVKHGLLHKQGEKTLSIMFTLQPKLLICTVKDNGIGRKRSMEINELRHKQYTSFATGATQKRLELLNYNKPQLISVQFTDLYNQHGVAAGTEVQIAIPIEVV